MESVASWCEMQVTVIVNSCFHGFPPEGVEHFPVTLGSSNLWIWGSLQLGNPIPSHGSNHHFPPNARNSLSPILRQTHIIFCIKCTIYIYIHTVSIRRLKSTILFPWYLCYPYQDIPLKIPQSRLSMAFPTGGIKVLTSGTAKRVWVWVVGLEHMLQNEKI